MKLNYSARQRAAAFMLAAITLFVQAAAHAATSASDPRHAAPDAITADGGRYYGPILNGVSQGKGRMEWDNGALYEGGFKGGLFSGHGTYRSASGKTYEGDFVNGSMSGTGTYKMLDGSVYTGAFRDDSFNGSGKIERPDGDNYTGEFKDGLYHGTGKLTTHSVTYEGEFQRGLYWGKGRETTPDGTYAGDFVRGRYQGKGRAESKDGEIFEGDFEDGEFVAGTATYKKNSTRFIGRFTHWRLEGAGKYEDGHGTVYEGTFTGGVLEGKGSMAGNGARYDGEFKQWVPEGKGKMVLANGDVYTGQFSMGLYQGQGTMTYVTPREDGRRHDMGIWRYGKLTTDKDASRALANAEAALYLQRQLLDKALAAITPRTPDKINLYLLAVAGDGSQEVFRREVEFVRDQFAERFGTKSHSLELINSRTTLTQSPMATVTSIKEGLKAIAGHMDLQQDILFFYMTSHGSRDHEFTLGQNTISLRGLEAKTLGDALRESGIRWKVIVISACYAGGFIDALKDDHTLVITAARHDRMSFGCADDNDFTYFGRAFFKESLPKSKSFQDAFRHADRLVREWETKDLKEAAASGEADEKEFSLPQMASSPMVERYLQLWWKQKQ
ncbi:MAG: C13 family peptidase [Betaproteobacteria bacterium]